MAGTREQLTPARRGGGAKSPARAARPRRSRVRFTLAIALSLLVLLTGGVGWLYLKLGGDINTFSSDGISGDRPDADASQGENVLVIGSDARTGGNEALGGGDKGDIGRSDTTFLLHVYADHRNAVAVSVPRDTLVTIPPCKLPDGSWTSNRPDTMFNAAYSTGETAGGNPACTQNTVEKLTGLRVDHTVVVDFKGFAALTDVVGGVKVCLPQAIYQRDLNPHRTTPGKLLFPRGEQSVSGQKALDYVRLRHGIGDGSDIGRIKRQQAFVGSLIKEIKSNGLTPTKLLPLANAATRSMTVDPGLGSADKLLSFAMSLKNVDLHNTKFVTIPWRYEGSRVAVVEPDADALWASLREDRTLDGKDASGKKGAGPSASPASSAAPDPGDGIRVTVYNGTTVMGLAAQAARALEDDGFTVTGTATANTRNQATTLIQYGPGEKTRAGTLAQRFPGARLEETSTAGIKAILGQDYADHPSTAATASPEPTGIPSDVSDDARSADDSLCSNLSYG
ncbi:transcriptional regulator [Streptomyces sp. CB01635]|uniref:LCP family protein n=1 Tax=unclassified Streptomyces TaxID=2593676 RepID=UPI000C271083|nr:LCP family protein [Streptomyces sp. CB01635]PJN13512.1 transcriptional regulator [Streptomyces sp. CB01635]